MEVQVQVEWVGEKRKTQNTRRKNSRGARSAEATSCARLRLRVAVTQTCVAPRSVSTRASLFSEASSDSSLLYTRKTREGRKSRKSRLYEHAPSTKACRGNRLLALLINGEVLIVEKDAYEEVQRSNTLYEYKPTRTHKTLYSTSLKPSATQLRHSGNDVCGQCQFVQCRRPLEKSLIISQAHKESSGLVLCTTSQVDY